MKKIVLILLASNLLFCFISCDLFDPSAVDEVMDNFLRNNPLDGDFWEKRTSFELKNNDGALKGAVTFVIDGKGYVGLGYVSNDNSVMNKELQMYDPDTNEWSSMSDFPGDGKACGVAFVLDGEAYIAGGYIWGSEQNQDSFDCWKYSPGSDSWTEIASITDPDPDANNFFDFSVSTVYEGQFLYQTANFSNLYTYEPESDTWTTTEIVNISYSTASTFYHSEESKYVYYTNITYTDYEDGTYTWEGETSTYEDVNDFIFSIHCYDLTSDAEEILFSDLSSSDYPADIVEHEIETDDGTITVGDCATTGVFIIEDDLYLFALTNPGTNLVRLTPYETETPEMLEWPDDLSSEDTEHYTFPIVFDDKVFFLDEDGDFYLYKP